MKNLLTKNHLWLGVKYFLISLFIGVIVRGFLLIPVPVTGNSMDQTLSQGDMVLMEKFSKVKRFDVIVFQQTDGTIYIKRVIGLPGDEIRYEKDQLYVNGHKMSESFLTNNRSHDHQVSPYTTDFQLNELIGEKSCRIMNILFWGIIDEFQKTVGLSGQFKAKIYWGKHKQFITH